MASSVLHVASAYNLSQYLQEIHKFPLLAPEEEVALARRWRDGQDTDAMHKLVTSHLRLAAKIAMGYRGYGLPVGELISEGNAGLLQAANRFDPDRGFFASLLMPFSGSVPRFRNTSCVPGRW
jgi:RNA polymerase sigma-32 factor